MKVVFVPQSGSHNNDVAMCSVAMATNDLN